MSHKRSEDIIELQSLLPFLLDKDNRRYTNSERLAHAAYRAIREQATNPYSLNPQDKLGREATVDLGVRCNFWKDTTVIQFIPGGNGEEQPPFAEVFMLGKKYGKKIGEKHQELEGDAFATILLSKDYRIHLKNRHLPRYTIQNMIGGERDPIAAIKRKEAEEERKWKHLLENKKRKYNKKERDEDQEKREQEPLED
ncbi:MAG TPA: hypothetical protein VJK51_01525 [Candidatus Nanoarchaeia archaeon]|nr:hypothetical protein [Candidatus Nanoarchaeia archaeon]